MKEDDIVREIEGACEEQAPSEALGDKVQRGVLFASIFRAIVNLYLGSLALVFGNTLKLRGIEPGSDIESDRDRQRKE